MSAHRGSRVGRVRSRAGSLSRQLALVVAIGVAPVLVALVIVSLLMVVSGHAALLVAAIVIAAGVLAILGARLIAGDIVQDVAAIRDGLAKVGRGNHDV